MTTITISSNAPAGSRITGIAASLFGYVLNQVRQYYQRRVTMAALRAMNSHQLKDIGIDPFNFQEIRADDVDAIIMANLMSLR